ncbi:hypothetical protein FCULG_00010415 [Fusarium culmorum]|uniref:Uncharacterized protein n=1 Tax=Fusarium culmorum TaxID=5516 RepID=A0A2T4GD85_FUSCU|nr:hypothetical protein FCULG_00010415 [Fusarium culmorum]
MYNLKKKHLEAAVEQNSICLLGLTSWSAAYILHKPNHGGTYTIASKQGNKTLPPELWNMILSYFEYDKYDPVYPVGITSVQLEHNISEPAVIFNKINSWCAFSGIKDGSDLSYYEDWLLNSSGGRKKQRPEYYPFFDFSKTVLPDQSITIPISHLEFNDNFLVCGLSAPQMIAHAEWGHVIYVVTVGSFALGARMGKLLWKNLPVYVPRGSAVVYKCFARYVLG